MQLSTQDYCSGIKIFGTFKSMDAVCIVEFDVEMDILSKQKSRIMLYIPYSIPNYFTYGGSTIPTCSVVGKKHICYWEESVSMGFCHVDENAPSTGTERIDRVGQCHSNL